MRAHDPAGLAQCLQAIGSFGEVVHRSEEQHDVEAAVGGREVSSVTELRGDAE